MAKYLEVGIDAVALLCIAESWVCIVFGPIVCLSAPIWIPGASIAVSAAIGVVVALLGLFFKWIGNGISNRKRGRMVLLGAICFLTAFPMLIPSPRPKPPQLYLYGVVYLGAALLLVAGVLKRKVQL